MGVKEATRCGPRPEVGLALASDAQRGPGKHPLAPRFWDPLDKAVMNQAAGEQRWVRSLVEIYRVRDGANGAGWLEAAQCTRFGCSDFYSDEEDGYDGGRPPGQGFTYASGERTIQTLAISGGTENRILVRVDRIDFTVHVSDPGVAYERIMEEILHSVCGEFLTEAWQDIETDLGIHFDSDLTPLHVEAKAYRIEPPVPDPSAPE